MKHQINSSFPHLLQQSRNRRGAWLVLGLVIVSTVMGGLLASQAFAATDVRVRAAHLAPFSDGDTAVNIKVNTYGINNKSFGQSSKYFERFGDEGIVQVELAADGTFVLSDTITYADSTDFTILVVGDGSNQPFEIVQLTDTTEAPAAGNFKLRLGHFAPFAAGTDATLADIRLDNGDVVAENVAFGDVSAYLELPAGEYDLKVTAPGGDTTLIDIEPEEFGEGEIVSVFAIGDGVNQDLGAFLFAQEGFGTILGLEETDPEPVPACEAASSTGTSFEFNYSNIPDGSVILRNGEEVGTASGDGSFTSDAADQEDGTELTFTIENDGSLVATCGTVTVVLPPAPTGGPRLYVAHLAPFAAGANSQVTVRLNGTDSLIEFEYGESTGYQEVLAGEYLVEVLPTGSETVAISATVTLTDGVDYTAIAAGDGANQALTIRPLIDDNAEPADGNFALRLGHFAPFADTSDATLADIRLQDGTLVLGNVPFGSVAPRVELVAGEYDLKITTPGGETTLIDPLPVTFNAGDIVSAFATGDGTNQELGVFAIVNGAVGTFLPLAGDEPGNTDARLYVAHLAPFSDDDGSSVTVRLNGTDSLTEFKYGDSTGYIVLPAGEYDVEILLTDTTTVAISETVTLEAMQDYTVLAVGDGVNQSLDLLPLNDDNSDPKDGFGKIRFGHAAPFANEALATRADIRLQDGTPKGSVIARNVPYSAMTEYLTLAAGTYDLVITAPGGGTVLLDPPAITLGDGEILTALVTGDGTNQNLNVFAISNGQKGSFIMDGTFTATTQIFLPVIR